MDGHGLVSYVNFADDDATVITVSASSSSTLVDGYPLDFLHTRQLAKPCRMSGVDGFTLDIDFGAARLVRVLAYLGVNFKVPNGAILFTYATSDDGSDYTTIESVVIQDNINAQITNSIIIPIPDGITSRYWRLTGQWTTPDASTVFDVGRLWMADAILLDEGVDGDWVLDVVDTGVVDESAGFQVYENKKTKRRRLQFNRTDLPTMIALGFDGIDEEEIGLDVPSFQGLELYAGSTGEVLAIPRTQSRLWVRRMAVYGRCTQIPAIKHQAGSRHAVSMVVLEEK